MEYIENQNFEFVPGENDDWQIRFLTGNYIETIIQYGTIRINEGEQMAFDFEIVSSPDNDLTTDDEELQNHASDVLVAIIEDAIKNRPDTLKTKEVK